MRLIRAFEEALAGVYARGELPTEMLHLPIGQEPTAVGALRANGILGARTSSPPEQPCRPNSGAAIRSCGHRRRRGDQRGHVPRSAQLSAVFKLPAIIVIENNLYGEFTPLSKQAGLQRLADRVWPMAAPA